MPLAQFGFLLPDDVRSDYGFQTPIIPPDPAAGQSFAHKVPGEFFEVLVSFSCVLTTSAAAANRAAFLQVVNGDGKQVDISVAFATVPALTTATYRWSLVASTALQLVANNFLMPAFPMVLPSGFQLVLGAGSLQAGDQFSSIGFVLQQYNTGIQPERFRDVAPLNVEQMGLVASVPLGSSTPSPAVLPGSSIAPSASPTRQPDAQPTPAPVTADQYLADIPQPVRGAPRVE